MVLEFQSRQEKGGSVHNPSVGDYTLSLPKSDESGYRLAQIDDYMALPRRKFLHKPPLILKLEARLSHRSLPGTWGFGFWNDPFSLGFIAGGVSRILPVLPNAAWFFYGSEANELTFYDNLPGNGFHIKTFRSPGLPSVASLLGIPILPLVLCPAGRRLIRRLARVFIKEDGTIVTKDVESWHMYCLSWEATQVNFFVDGKSVFSTTVVPHGSLGIVIWIDNQYFCFNNNGKLAFGVHPVLEEQWMQIRNLEIRSSSPCEVNCSNGTFGNL